jgi:hypothetical protein
MKKEKYIFVGDFQVNFKGKLYSVDQAAIIPPKFKHSISGEDSLVLLLFFEKHNKYF